MTQVDSPATILVTGATGFLGVPLVKRLARDGYRVTALGRREQPPDFAEGVEYLSIDLEEGNAASRLRPFRWDGVVHLAGAAPKTELSWEEGAELIASHVRMAAALLALIPAGWQGRLVHASGFIVYGMPESLPVTENHARRPLHAYALAKALAEDVLLVGAGADLDLWVLRLPGLFSEGRRSGALFRFAAAALAGEDLIVEAERPLPWEVLHVDDAVDSIVRSLISRRRAPGPVNVGYGEPVDLLSMAGRIAARAGKGSRVERRGSAMPVSFQMETTRMRELIGQPSHTLDRRLDQLLASVRADS